jgi:hypothetical protein
MSEKSNDINGLRKRNNVHNNNDMKEYVVDLWMQGTSAHVIERMVRSKINQRWRNNKAKQSA